MAQKYAAADQAVYSYRFDQPAPNATIALGVRLELSQTSLCLSS